MTDSHPPYRLLAYNSARQSENKMHDDSVARQFGFLGGLVPGVDVYAYMAHPAVGCWRRAFLERGTLEARFVRPVYDGELTTVTAREANGGLDIEVTCRQQLCATGHATLATTPAPPIAAFKDVASRRTALAGRSGDPEAGAVARHPAPRRDGAIRRAILRCCA